MSLEPVWESFVFTEHSEKKWVTGIFFLIQQVEELLRAFEQSSMKDNADKYIQLIQLCCRLDVATLHELFRSHANNRRVRYIGYIAQTS